MRGTVRLRTGKEVPEAALITVRISTGILLEKHPIAIYELVMACRDSSHVPFRQTGPAIAEVGLAEVRSDGTLRIHDITRDIVLASVDGDGAGLAMVPPVAATDGAA
jgi:hypothetical protein